MPLGTSRLSMPTSGPTGTVRDRGGGSSSSQTATVALFALLVSLALGASGGNGRGLGPAARRWPLRASGWSSAAIYLHGGEVGFEVGALRLPGGEGPAVTACGATKMRMGTESKRSRTTAVTSSSFSSTTQGWSSFSAGGLSGSPTVARPTATRPCTRTGKRNNETIREPASTGRSHAEG